MTDVTTNFSLRVQTVSGGAGATQTSMGVAEFALSNTVAFVGGTGGAAGGISQSAADARYVQKTQVNAASGVAGLDASKFLSEPQLPLPAVDLTVLFNNKLA